MFGEDVIVDWLIIGDCKEFDVCGVYFGLYCYLVVIDLFVCGFVMLKGIVMYGFVFEDWDDVICVVKLFELIKVLLKLVC